MRRQVGILIMKDENDILNEYLTKITQYYDKILVLDGSNDDEGEKICAQFPEVIFYEKDKNVIKDKINDSTTRGFLWQKAKELVDNKLWVGVLHPDEFPSNNPLEMLEQLPNEGFDVVMIQNEHFFLHKSQKDTWDFKPGDLIEPKMKYYMAPGHPEYRYFRFNKNFVYGNMHSTTVPMNVNGVIHVPTFSHKQFTYRTLEQAKKRAKTRWDSGWQMNDYLLVLETGDMFFDTLAYPKEYQKKYPKEYNTCWYNQPHAYVAKID
jgi:hypothetical protein